MGLMLVVGMFWLVVLGALALVVILAMRSRPSVPYTNAPGRETALDILDRRFAAGEITADEYKRSRDILRGEGKG
jgi:uncharacterized membrane protein